VKIDLSAQEDILTDIKRVQEKGNNDYILQPEYGKWMIECNFLFIYVILLTGVPSKPFEYKDVVELEISMENL